MTVATAEALMAAAERSPIAAAPASRSRHVAPAGPWPSRRSAPWGRAPGGALVFLLIEAARLRLVAV